jgi:TonB family protein
MKTIKSILTLILLVICFGCMNRAINQNSPSLGNKEPHFIKGGELRGHRSRPNVMSGIMKNIGKLRKIYNEEYKDSTGGKLEIIVKFKIDYLGNVVSSETTESNSNNPEFDSKLLNAINTFQFGQIDQIADTTRITYPLIFRK